MSSEVIYDGPTSAQSRDCTWLNVRKICKTSVLFNALINSLSVVPKACAWLLFHVKSEVCSRLGAFLTPDAHRHKNAKYPDQSSSRWLRHKFATERQENELAKQCCLRPLLCKVGTERESITPVIEEVKLRHGQFPTYFGTLTVVHHLRSQSG